MVGDGGGSGPGSGFGVDAGSGSSGGFILVSFPEAKRVSCDSGHASNSTGIKINIFKGDSIAFIFLSPLLNSLYALMAAALGRGMKRPYGFFTGILSGCGACSIRPVRMIIWFARRYTV